MSLKLSIKSNSSNKFPSTLILIELAMETGALDCGCRGEWGALDGWGKGDEGRAALR